MEANPPHYAERGPFAVGALQASVTATGDAGGPDRELPCEIWYPAEPGQPEREDAPHPLGLPHRASLGLAPAESRRSLIAFSHGNSGLRQQSTFLTTHLASWGHVVVAPDHVGNTFPEMLALEGEEARREAHLRARRNRPRDLAAAVGALLDDDRLRERLPPIDPTRLGLLGHSFGGWTVLKVPALEGRVRSVCCLAPASEPFVGRKAFEPGELPLGPSIDGLLLAARDDVLVDLETSIQPLHDRLGPRTRLEVIDRTDHFHFCDGIELLHKMHENNPREGQLRPTRPAAELRGEDETHSLLQERVARHFAATLGGAPEARTR